ncbi:hypothetical protein [Pelagerythrobacter marinus]|uniref:hypothetical protein n=1 Tax=Pelagerythrobacter marinus TaxID=538382 RepID=UPI002AC9CE73|nr:hypothetical protein [Pelagerythrobacter marinus]WPZ05664.1 hypothetical protein T8T98_09500 [Pelagerythrobacter marinus]
MTRALTLLAALTSTAAIAGPDYPHRDWGQTLALDMTATEATACMARELDRQGEALIVPAEGGSDIDFSSDAMFGGAVGEPWIRFQIREDDDATTLSALYRHPVNKRWIARVLRNAEKRCLKVAA